MTRSRGRRRWHRQKRLKRVSCNECANKSQYEGQSRGTNMKSRIRGREAARAAVATTERLPVTLQATDLVGPFQPISNRNERVAARCGATWTLNRRSTATPKWVIFDRIRLSALCHVRFASDSDRIADIVGGPFRATTGLMHRNKSLQHSIRSQAISERQFGCHLACVVE